MSSYKRSAVIIVVLGLSIFSQAYKKLDQNIKVGEEKSYKQITATDDIETEPALSPDLKWVAYVYKRKYLSGDIWLKSTVDNGEIRITKGRGIPPADFVPYSYGVRWAPDSESLLYVSSHTGNYEVFLYYKGKNINLSNHPEWDGAPVFSPDGTKIAFVSARDGNGEIYLIDCGREKITGENVRNCPLIRLTKNEYLDVFPIFISNEEIIYTSRSDTMYNLYLLYKMGNEYKTKLLFGSEDDERFVSISPDMMKIAFFCSSDICIFRHVNKIIAERDTQNQYKDQLIRIKLPQGIYILPNGPQWLDNSRIVVVSLDPEKSLYSIEIESAKAEKLSLGTVENYWIDIKKGVLAVAAFKFIDSLTFNDIYLFLQYKK
ncbi:MAG: hypothetical protein QXI58_05640 [Candidatus Micrarchaeia archaeon]